MSAQSPVRASIVSEPLRSLSPYERLFTAIEQVNGLSFSVAVGFRGTLAHSRWIVAFAQAQQRHPFLNATLDHNDPHAPELLRADGSAIPLTFQRRTSPTQWERVMETEFAEPFNPLSAPLLRAILLEDEQGCDLIVTAYHTVLDGMGTLLFVRDVLNALAGEALSVLPTPPPAEGRVNAVRASTRTQRPQISQALEAVLQRAAGRPTRAFTARPGRGRSTVTALRLSPAETDLLLRCARRQETTVGCVLLAALASAVRILTPSLHDADIHVVSPVDTRPFLENSDDFVLSIIVAQAICLCADSGLWESARALRSQLLPFQCLDEIEASYDRTASAMAMKLDPATLVNILATQYGNDAMVTNLKCIDFPTVPDGLTVDAVWGPSVSGVNVGGQVLGVATFAGALHMVYTSHSPLTGLLETIQQMIAAACADA